MGLRYLVVMLEPRVEELLQVKKRHLPLLLGLSFRFRIACKAARRDKNLYILISEYGRKGPQPRFLV